MREVGRPGRPPAQSRFLRGLRKDRHRPHGNLALVVATFPFLIAACTSSGLPPGQSLPPTPASTASRTAPQHSAQVAVPSQPPFSVLVQLTNADGRPATAAIAYGTVTTGNEVRTIDRQTTGNGAWLLSFDGPGSYCIAIQAMNPAAGESPVFTLDSSGSLVANSYVASSTTDYHQGCSFDIGNTPRQVEVQVPPVRNVRGVVRSRSLRPCSDFPVRAVSGMLEVDTHTEDDGSFSLYLSPGAWLLNGTNVSVGDWDLPGWLLYCSD